MVYCVYCKISSSLQQRQRSLYPSAKNAFQLKGAEKSFIVIASHENAQNEWVTKINEARVALGVHEDAAFSLAPVWETDHSGGGCCVCNQVSF